MDFGDKEADPIGSRVELLTPGGTVAGCYQLEEPGLLKLTHVYGADGEAIPGFQPGEPLTVRVNGVTATTEPLTWQDDKAPHLINIATDIRLFIPLVR
jgi:hypothetical protein